MRLEDGGPVFFRQERVGLDGSAFTVLKLRTMVVGAEAQGAGYAVDRGDSRITRIGRLLRGTSIDELPQLWNVLARRHEPRRPATDARLPGGAATTSASAAGSRSGPASPAGRR